MAASMSGGSEAATASIALVKRWKPVTARASSKAARLSKWR
jgi:hypothetical protein